MFGLYFIITPQEKNITKVDPTLFTPIFNVFAHGVLVIAGFGLIFSYLRKMAWSGMGFSLLICALCMQFYFMWNAFWIKADVLNANQRVFTDDDKTYNIYLSGML